MNQEAAWAVMHTAKGLGECFADKRRGCVAQRDGVARQQRGQNGDQRDKYRIIPGRDHVDHALGHASHLVLETRVGVDATLCRERLGREVAQRAHLSDAHLDLAPRRRQRLAHEFADVPGNLLGLALEGVDARAHALDALVDGQRAPVAKRRVRAVERGERLLARRPRCVPRDGARVRRAQHVAAARRRHRRAARMRRGPRVARAPRAPIHARGARARARAARGPPSHARTPDRVERLRLHDSKHALKKVTSGVIWPQGSSRTDVNPEP